MSATLASPVDPGHVQAHARVHALVRTQGRTIAIPSHCVVQAIEAPGALTQVPRRTGAIEGVMTLGRRVLPVVNLARWLEPVALDESDYAAVASPPSLVLLLKDGDQCIGLAVEAVIGVQKLRPDQVCRLFHDERPDELFQSAALFGNDTEPTSILDPRRLMAQAGVWVADAALDGLGGSEASEDAAPAARTAQRSETVAHATFRIADVHVALPTRHVGELLRHPRLRKELLPHDGVQGLCEWRGRQVPVVDLTGALQALPADQAGAWVCIVCEGNLALGVVMHEVLEIARLTAAEGTPDHASADERAVISRRLVMGDRTLQVIDVAALMRRYPEAAISGRNVGHGAHAVRQQAAGAEVAPAYMVFDAGGSFAARIDGVQEVVPLPAELQPRLDAGLSTTLQWREQPVPVVTIGDSLVTLPAQAARQLVIVRQDGRLAALAIDAVRALVPRGVAQRNRMRMQGRQVEVISVETEDHRASYAVVDLCGGLRPAA